MRLAIFRSRKEPTNSAEEANFQSGALWDINRAHYGREDSSTLVWVAAAPVMNPTLTADYLERMQAEDPEGFRSEVLAEFRAGISTFLDPDAIDQCISDRRNLLPVAGLRYFPATDPSGMRNDAFTVAISHADPKARGRVVVDHVQAWPPKSTSTKAVYQEIATLLRRFGCSHVVGDNYGADLVVDGFRDVGIAFRKSDVNRSEAYLELQPLILAGAVELPNDPALLRELRGLERRRGFAGKDRVDHPSRAGAHDDRANALAVSVYYAARRRGVSGTVEISGL